MASAAYDQEDLELIQALDEFERTQRSLFDMKDKPFFVGLRNVGNTCYISAAVLSVYHQSGTRHLFCELIHKAKHDFQHSATREDLRFFRNFVRLFMSILIDNSDQSLDMCLTEFVQDICKYLPQFQPELQQDADELMFRIFGKVEEQILNLSIRPTTYRVKFDKIFSINIDQQFLCSEKHFTGSTDSGYGLFLTVDKPCMLQDLVANYFKLSATSSEETIPCPICHEPRAGHRIRQISVLPSTMMIRLNRTTPQTNEVSIIVQIQLNVDMTEFLSDELKEIHPLAQYHLNAVIFYFGNGKEKGHYTCMLWQKMEESVAKWFYYDNEAVTNHMSPHDHLKQLNQNIYMLMYERESLDTTIENSLSHSLSVICLGNKS